MLGDIISGAGKIIGGLMGKEDAEDARYAAATHAAAQMQAQKAFAQQGIRWRVEDAKKAGIHPIYALGAAGATYTPVSSSFAADTSMANALAGAGQDIGNAINRTRTQGERVDAFTTAAQKLALEKGGLENEVLRLELASKAARLRQENAPAFPGGDRMLIPGQGQTAGGSLIKDKPQERTPPHPSEKYSEPGAVVDRGFSRTSGGLYPTPSSDIKEKIEDNWYHETMHFIRNNLLPMISPAFNDPPKGEPLKPGFAWVYDPVYGYKQVPDKWYRKFIRN